MEKKVRHPPSAFLLYSKDIRKEVYKEFGWYNSSVEIAKRWKFLDSSTKSAYKERARVMREEYNLHKPPNENRKGKRKPRKGLQNAAMNLLNIENFDDLSQLFEPLSGKQRKEKQPAPAPLVPPIPKVKKIKPPPKRPRKNKKAEKEETQKAT